jgi:hypothetical protein
MVCTQRQYILLESSYLVVVSVVVVVVVWASAFVVISIFQFLPISCCWARYAYRSSPNQPPGINPASIAMLTHINYAFMTISYHTASDTYYVDHGDPWADLGLCMGPDVDQCSNGKMCMSVKVGACCDENGMLCQGGPGDLHGVQRRPMHMLQRMLVKVGAYFAVHAVPCMVLYACSL